MFDNIKADEYKVLMTCINGNIRKFSSNDYVFLAGSQISFVGIVLTGAVEIIKENPAGARLIMDVLGPAHIFGEGIVCTKARIAPVSVRVKEESQIRQPSSVRQSDPVGSPFHQRLQLRRPDWRCQNCTAKTSLFLSTTPKRTCFQVLFCCRKFRIIRL